MALLLFNSLSRQKEEFKTIKPQQASMYVCGITPNNAAHLGHAFTYVSFDVLVRYLRFKAYEVNYLQNATDINDSDDVIIQAKKAGRTWEQEASYWISYFHKQMDALHVLRPTKYVLATSVIDKIIAINLELFQKGFAYQSGGNLYFEINKFKEYGALSKFTREQMIILARERGNNLEDKNKKNPLDFVLWYGDEREPYWSSPWGNGRPGWHIECSSMIFDYLGPRIDIHGGGRDLIYPHHESEIAQSESYTSEKFVNTWMHTGMVLYEGEKMSKSLNNLVLVSELLEKYSPAAIRWLLLSHHYRSPWEFEEYDLQQIEKKVEQISHAVSGARKADTIISEFEIFMDDDMNTPKVLELVERLVFEEKKEQAFAILEILGFNFR